MSAGDFLDEHAERDLATVSRILTYPERERVVPSVTFLHARELMAHPAPLQWDVRGIFTRASMVALVGAAGTYKSNVATDIAASIATGATWHGRQTRSGSVFYIAGEGNSGISRRLKAWEIYRQVPLHNAPLFISTGGTSLIEPLNAAAVAGEVDQLARTYCSTPTLVIVDTLARNFGAGDENSASDMGRFIENLDRHLREPFACTVIVLHHTGVSSADRGRGSSAFRAAVDTEILFERSNRVVTLRCTKSKEAPEFEPLAFEARSVELPWLGEDGEPESSFVMHLRESVPLIAPVAARLGENQRNGLAALKQLYHEQRARLAEHGHNSGSALVLVEDWKNRVADRRRFFEIKNALEKRNLIRIEGKYVHLQASE